MIFGGESRDACRFSAVGGATTTRCCVVTVATGLLTSGFSPAPARGSSGGRFDITGRGPPSRRRRSSTNHALAAAMANEMTAVAINDRDGSPPAAFVPASGETVTVTFASALFPEPSIARA